MTELITDADDKPTAREEISRRARENGFLVLEQCTAPGAITDNDPRILRLPDGAPAFQVDESGQLRPVVASINQLLDAATDPWAAADWWFLPNTWLHGQCPYQMLRQVGDNTLIRAAIAAIEG
jgi:hypothetical protein